MVALIVIIVVALVVIVTLARTIRIVPQARAGVVERLGRYSRTLTPGLDARRPVHRPHAADDRPARAGRLVPAAAGDHRGQPRGQHRLRHLLPGHRREGRDLRDRELHPGDRAAHGHHAPQRDRRPGAREDAHLARRDQRPAARRARRRDRQVGHPRQPRRAEGDRPAGLDPGLDGEADARRPRQAGHDPAGGGRAAVRRSSRPRARSSRRSSGPRARSRPRCCGPRARRRRSRRSSAAIHEGKPDAELLAYQYLQMLPQIAQGEANKVWIIPSDLQQAIGRVAGAVKELGRRRLQRRRTGKKPE